MIVSNVTCLKIEYIRLKHEKWLVWSFNSENCHAKSRLWLFVISLHPFILLSSFKVFICHCFLDCAS
ncbi:hypothetical protein LDENG_00153170 [Lucifuga dentata]|nr:hypothetical protein LDENG_00153170 [Lucifuga dentata]